MGEESKIKHQMLSDWIREKILSGVYGAGERIPSEYELAEQFHMSRQTVRRAVETLEREGLLVRARGSGTYVRTPSAFTPQNVKSVGIVTTYLNDYVFPSIIQGVDSVLTPRGYSMMLSITYNKTVSEAKALEQMLSSGTSGLIVEGTKSALPNANIGMFRTLREKGIPIIFINGYYNEFCESYVVMDDVKAGQLLVDHLVKNNHLKIGGIFKSDDIQGLKRYEGVSKQAQSHHLSMEDNSILWYTTEDLNYLFEGEMDEIILERLKDVTAVVCYNDQIAVSLIQMLKRHGKKVPEDISLVSFDNSYLAKQAAYNLTSVTYYGRQIGQTAAQHLLKQMEKKEEVCKIKLEPTLKLRQSVRRLPD